METSQLGTISREFLLPVRQEARSSSWPRRSETNREPSVLRSYAKTSD